MSGTFLETTSSGSNVEVSAYNDGDGMANTPDNNRYTTLGEPLTLADAGIITYASTRVVAFYLDANQSGKDDGVLGNNYYDVTKLQIWYSDSETVTSPNGRRKCTLCLLLYGNGEGKPTSPVLRKWSCKLGHRALCSSYSIWTLHLITTFI